MYALRLAKAYCESKLGGSEMSGLSETAATFQNRQIKLLKSNQVIEIWSLYCKGHDVIAEVHAFYFSSNSINV